MPGFDGTGPMGMGPMTGRGMGFCGFGLGRKFGMRRGFGRFGMGWMQPANKDEELKAMQDYLKTLEEEIEDVKAKVTELSK
jgi:Family of unknown function (DUF5320)